MSRARDRKGTRAPHGERYARVPDEVMVSASYNALPFVAIAVLNVLAGQWGGGRNGCIALPFPVAKERSIRTRAQLYASLQILEAAHLITCTRRGRFEGGTPLPTLYALTWLRIDVPPEGVRYDGTIGPTLKPSHDWVRWERPDDWDEQVRTITSRARGRHDRPFPGKSGVTPPVIGPVTPPVIGGPISDHTPCDPKSQFGRDLRSHPLCHFLDLHRGTPLGGGGSRSGGTDSDPSLVPSSTYDEGKGVSAENARLRRRSRGRSR